MRLFLAFAGAATLAGAAAAEGLSGGVGIVSEKVSRGISQTPGHPVALLDLVYRWDSGWAVGAGAAGMNDGVRGANATEAGLTLAHHWQPAADWHTQLSATHYRYPGSRDPRYRAHSELGAGVDWRGLLSLNLLVAPDGVGLSAARERTRGLVWALEASAHLPITGRWSLDAGLGWQDPRRVGGTAYGYGSLGFSWGRGPVSVFASWITGQADERAGVPQRFAGDRAVVSVWLAF